MSNPTVTGSAASPTAAIGSTITITANYGDADTKNMVVTLKAMDAEGNVSALLNIPIVIDPVTLEISSVPARTWTKISDTGAVAVFTAVA